MSSPPQPFSFPLVPIIPPLASSLPHPWALAGRGGALELLSKLWQLLLTPHAPVLPSPGLPAACSAASMASMGWAPERDTAVHVGPSGCQGKRMMASLILLPVPLLLQLQMLLALLAAWLADAQLMLPRASWAFPAELLPTLAASSLCCCTGLFLPGAGTLVWP